MCKFSSFSYNEYIRVGASNAASQPGKVSSTNLYASSTATITASFQSTGTDEYKSIIMLGAFKSYVLFKIRIVSLIDSGLTTEQLFDLKLPNINIIHTVGPDLLDPYRPGFAVLLNSKLAFVFRVSLDSCLNRNPSKVCIQCEAGLIFNSLEPNNYCITKAQFLPGFGLNPANNAMTRCRSMGCLDCKDDYNICLTCNVAEGFCTNPKNTDFCTTYDNLDNGYGLRVPLPLTAEPCFLPCSMPFCNQCMSNYQKCTRCSDAQTPPVYLDPISGTCVTEASISIGRGVDLVMQEVGACATGCLECQSNTIFCTKCDNSNNYFIMPDKRCILAS